MGDSVFIAHIADDGREQLTQQHCRKTAEYAENSLKGIGLAKTAYLAGLLHDAGKFKEEFVKYLKAAKEDPDSVRRGSVNHTFAGTRYVLEHWQAAAEDSYFQITAELVAYAIGAHHGLFDCIDENQKNGFMYRMEKEKIGYGESIRNYHLYCSNEDELDNLFRDAKKETEEIITKIQNLTEQQQDNDLANSEMYFHIGLLERMLLSAVIEGDCRDTAEFMKNKVALKWPEDMQDIWSKRLEYMETKLKEFPSEKPIQKARQKISETCREFADNPGGVFRLNVPTGGGKTLASLRYALAHAKKWKKSRIVFTAPLLSILDQNASIIRKYVGDDSLILEHHSNLLEPEKDDDELDWLELMTETWEAPVIITTLVQLLNTFFAGKKSSIRRLHALCDSIIVIDEVQSVPAKMLTLFNLAVNFLSEVCKATIVLCSATQPNLEEVIHPLKSPIKEIVPWEENLWHAFKRTEIQDEGNYRLEELPQIVENALEGCGSLLVVCNKKNEAEYIYENVACGNVRRFHLSASMCTQHRRDTLEELEAALSVEQVAREGKILCVSTQVIEAGVDISFQRVIRFAAGMDSIIQSAGRCNRNANNSEVGIVSIVQCTDENLNNLKDIQWGKTATIALLSAYKGNPEKFDNDLAGKKAIEFYYDKLYRSMDKGFHDYVVEDHGTLFDLLSDNPTYADVNCQGVDEFFMRQAFRLAGEQFQVFDQNTTDILVPYRRGSLIREELIEESKKYADKDYEHIEQLIKEAKLYSVSLFQWQIDQLNEQNALIPLLDERVYALADGFYDENIGFSLKKTVTNYWEV